MWALLQGCCYSYQRLRTHPQYIVKTWLVFSPPPPFFPRPPSLQLFSCSVFLCFQPRSLIHNLQPYGVREREREQRIKSRKREKLKWQEVHELRARRGAVMCFVSVCVYWGHLIQFNKMSTFIVIPTYVSEYIMENFVLWVTANSKQNESMLHKTWATIKRRS